MAWFRWFEIEAARSVWAIGVHLLRKEQKLPAAPDRVNGRCLLLRKLFLGLILCGLGSCKVPSPSRSIETQAGFLRTTL